MCKITIRIEDKPDGSVELYRGTEILGTTYSLDPSLAECAADVAVWKAKKYIEEHGTLICSE